MSYRLAEVLQLMRGAASRPNLHVASVSVRQWLSAVKTNAACYLTWPLTTRTSCKWMLVGVGYHQNSAESPQEDPGLADDFMSPHSEVQGSSNTLAHQLWFPDHDNKSVIKFDRSKYNSHRSGRFPLALFPSVVAAAAVFSWDDDKTIKEEEMGATAKDIGLICNKPGVLIVDEKSKTLEGWEKVMDRDNIKVYRRPVSGSSHLFEYKTFGTFSDIPARAFFNAQLDIEYRKQWDKLVVKLDIVDRDEKSGTEVVHWITHFPYPMYQRDYVFLRRSMVDARRRVMVIVSRYTEHPACPPSDSVVRVDSYMSNMVIKPHGKSFDDNGLDYVVTYYDDPKSSIPTVAYKWVASKGVPDFLEKVHAAAKTLHERRSAARQTEDGEYPTDRIPM